MYNLATACFVQIDRENFHIRIGIQSSVKDIQVLFTILKYIVPTGWIIDIFFYAEMKIWQGYAYKDTFVNMVRKASAKNALYIIDTRIGTSTQTSDGQPTTDIIGMVGGTASSGSNYSTFGTKKSITNQAAVTNYTNTTHITKYTGSIAINAMESTAIESFIDEPENLMKFGTELWDAKGYFRFNPDRYGRSEDSHGKRQK